MHSKVKIRRVLIIFNGFVIISFTLLFYSLYHSESKWEENLKSLNYFNQKIFFNSQKSHPNIANLPDFVYLRNNEDLCSNTPNPILLILVHSARSHMSRRNTLRKTLQSFKVVYEWNIRLVFLLGSPSEFGVNPSDGIESIGDDIIMGNFVDSYRNMSYKHIMGYHWAINYCSEAKYIFKMDDDVYADLFYLAMLISEIEKNDKQIACSNMGGTVPIRNTSHKAYVTFEEYQPSIFPDYCSGMGYLISMEAVKAIYKIHHVVKYLWIDDIWVTGILRQIVEEKGNLKLGIYSINHKLYFLPTNWTKVGELTAWYTNFGDLSKIPWPIMLLDWDARNTTDDFESRVLAAHFKVLAVLMNNTEIEYTLSNKIL